MAKGALPDVRADMIALKGSDKFEPETARETDVDADADTDADADSDSGPIGRADPKRAVSCARSDAIVCCSWVTPFSSETFITVSVSRRHCRGV
jgi:hypothetical protein